MQFYLPKWLILSIFAIIVGGSFKYSNELFKYSKNLEIFSSVYRTVQEDYVEEVPPSKMAQTAVKKMLESLDPYTVFFSEYQAEEALIERQGEYGGVGCRVIKRNDFPMVTEIVPGYGFDKAGIKLGDYILATEDVSLYKKDMGEMMQYFRGAPNSQFEITILRDTDTLTKTITRAHVEQKSVSQTRIIKGNYGYIKLDEFGTACASEIEHALRNQLDSSRINGLVLDLRNNGGGLLDQAVEIVGLFVPKNTSIVTLKGKHHEGPKNWKTPKEPLALTLPLVVLINERSASASEVVSGSLQDLDRALIMGSNSFGKGLVQHYKNLPYRTQMKITTARYHTPSGRCVQRINYSLDQAIKTTQKRKPFKTKNGRLVYDGGGVDPDVDIKSSQEQQFIQWLEKNHVFFDYAQTQKNRWAEDKMNDAFALLSDFTKFAQRRTIELTHKLFDKQVKENSDSIITHQKSFFQINEASINQWVSRHIKDYQESFLFKLRFHITEHLKDKVTAEKAMINDDPLINMAKSKLNNPKEIKEILRN
ncbi:S41 family peptidase [Bacteroidia bacterium]|nr:S41 family peptidase [Bacteroidia bacterium]MDA9213744.1 S41 family peptidase [Bacteroidia bacterium]